VGNTYYNYDEQRDENESLPNINFRIEGKENVGARTYIMIASSVYSPNCAIVVL